VSNQEYTHASLAILPRQPSYLYICLVGFVDAGETFNSEVTRETYEEFGGDINHDSIKYI